MQDLYKYLMHVLLTSTLELFQISFSSFSHSSESEIIPVENDVIPDTVTVFEVGFSLCRHLGMD